MFGTREHTRASPISLHSFADDTLDDSRQYSNLEQTYTATTKGKCLDLAVLILPTVMSALLLAANFQGWEVSGGLYTFITQDRATAQLIVQVMANALKLSEVWIICRLVNYATRIRLNNSSTTLDTVGLWAALSTPTMDWRLPPRMALLLLAFAGLSPSLSALWAGALTPVETTGFRTTTVSTQDWTDISLVKEYPSEIDQTGPSIIDAKGHFTYSVGLSLLTPLVSSAQSATTADGSLRTHSKFDNSGFAYRGRSYGVGASVGLLDDSITVNKLATNYTFQEIGYDASVSCIHNRSSLFFLHPTSGDLLYAAAGPLPDSNGVREYSVYVGRDDSAIVAAGVSHIQTTGKRYVAMAAGSYYDHFDSAQCSIEYKPSLFNVSVGVIDKQISVQKVSDAPDPDPARNVTHIATRQIELISNDLTGLYRSALGDAFNTSISDHITFVSKSQSPSETPTLEEATLAGLTNSLTAMIDDILGSYAAAQLMVGNFSAPTPATVQVTSLRLGSPIYIIAIAVLNSIVTVLVIEEAVRTRGWRHLLSFDYTDLRSIITASFLGGASTSASAAAAGARASTSAELPDATDGRQQHGKMEVRLGATDYPDKIQHFQIALGNNV